MEQGRVERRREKRVAVQAPMLIRRIATGEEEPFVEQRTGNVSLGGLYFEAEEGATYAAHQTVVASVSIPQATTRDFPFRRLAGRGRIVRIEKVPHRGQGGPRRMGVAVEFGDDVTAFTGIPVPG